MAYSSPQRTHLPNAINTVTASRPSQRTHLPSTDHQFQPKTNTQIEKQHSHQFKAKPSIPF